MQKQRLILIIGIALGLLAVFMAKVYIDQQRSIIQDQAKKAVAQIQASQTAVLVAKKDILRGTVIEPEMLETAIIPNQYIQPQAVASLDRIAGMIAVAPISKGEQISLSKLSYSKQEGAGGGSLAEATPIGKRAVTISVDNLASLAGMVKSGDYVDIIAMLPVPVQTAEGKQATQAAVMPLFQNVLVLAVGQEIGAIAMAQPESRYKREEKREASPSPLITLALNPQEASLIAFVQEQGRIRLILRSPADSKIESLQPASWETLFQYLMPREAVKAQVPDESAGYVEIYRGMSKERIPLSTK